MMNMINFEYLSSVAMPTLIVTVKHHINKQINIYLVMKTHKLSK